MRTHHQSGLPGQGAVSRSGQACAHASCMLPCHSCCEQQCSGIRHGCTEELVAGHCADARMAPVFSLYRSRPSSSCSGHRNCTGVEAGAALERPQVSLGWAATQADLLEVAGAQGFIHAVPLIPRPVLGLRSMACQHALLRQQGWQVWCLLARAVSWFCARMLCKL